MRPEVLDINDLSPVEADTYWDGRWLAANPVRSSRLDRLRRGPDMGEDAAAELAARVRIELAGGDADSRPTA